MRAVHALGGLKQASTLFEHAALLALRKKDILPIRDRLTGVSPKRRAQRSDVPDLSSYELQDSTDHGRH